MMQRYINFGFNHKRNKKNAAAIHIVHRKLFNNNVLTPHLFFFE